CARKRALYYEGYFDVW
nr:immunoglobulin heavy chain junction region [Mus musculus]